MDGRNLNQWRNVDDWISNAIVGVRMQHCFGSPVPKKNQLLKYSLAIWKQIHSIMCQSKLIEMTARYSVPQFNQFTIVPFQVPISPCECLNVTKIIKNIIHKWMQNKITFWWQFAFGPRVPPCCHNYPEISVLPPPISSLHQSHKCPIRYSTTRCQLFKTCIQAYNNRSEEEVKEHLGAAYNSLQFPKPKENHHSSGSEGFNKRG